MQQLAECDIFLGSFVLKVDQCSSKVIVLLNAIEA
jgi:hypothetical protein